MDTLTYSLLAGLALLFVSLFVINERRKYRRYKRLVDMDVEVLFQESDDPYDYQRRGSVLLHLRGSDEHVKAIVIKSLSFSHAAFHVPAIDQLYFKGKAAGVENQLLSVSFRIRRHTLRRLEGKQLHVYLSGWISDREGTAKPFKARVPYTIGSFSNDSPSDNAPTASMTALT